MFYTLEYSCRTFENGAPTRCSVKVPSPPSFIPLVVQTRIQAPSGRFPTKSSREKLYTTQSQNFWLKNQLDPRSERNSASVLVKGKILSRCCKFQKYLSLLCAPNRYLASIICRRCKEKNRWGLKGEEFGARITRNGVTSRILRPSS